MNDYLAIADEGRLTGRNGFSVHVCPHLQGSLAAKVWLWAWADGNREYKRLKALRVDLERTREQIA